MPVLELVMRFSPSHNRSRRSITAHQNTCPLHGELELEVLRNIEGLELVVVAKGKCYSMEIPICVQLAVSMSVQSLNFTIFLSAI